MNADVLTPRPHTAPVDWPAGVFEAVTDALAAALVAAVKRAEASQERPSGKRVAAPDDGRGGPR